MPRSQRCSRSECRLRGRQLTAMNIPKGRRRPVRANPSSVQSTGPVQPYLRPPLWKSARNPHRCDRYGKPGFAPKTPMKSIIEIPDGLSRCDWTRAAEQQTRLKDKIARLREAGLALPLRRMPTTRRIRLESLARLRRPNAGLAPPSRAPAPPHRLARPESTTAAI